MRDWIILGLLASIYSLSGVVDSQLLLPLTLVSTFYIGSRQKCYITVLVLSGLCTIFLKITWLVYPLTILIMYLFIEKERCKVKSLQDDIRITQDVDSLSGLYNNRFVLDYLDNRLKHVNGNPLSVLLMDVDGFRRINEKFGHAYGDLLISEIAKLLKGLSDETDILGRYGGEEFILVLNNGTLERSITIADEIKQGIEEMPIRDEMKITMSIGIAFNDNDTAEGLIKKADLQLVQAKKLGKGDLK